ncbi:MAG TPA: FtsX-like permease family protein [Leeuwenhoekiella sp.]|nr:FtsX-like permease family protein [Leeuwenhoekiella sp.]
MFKNYIKLAWRNMCKNGVYTAIMLFGLSIGLTVVLLIGGYVWHELQVNQYLKHADRQYLLTSNWKDPNMGVDFTTVAPLAQRLKEDYPQYIENYYRWDGITSTISKGSKKFRENLLVGDATLLSTFGFKLAYGNAKTVFKNPFSVVLTEAMALKYFGKKDIVGETLLIENFSGEQQNFKITGVLKKMPKNSINQLQKGDVNSFYLSKSALDYFGRTSFDSWSNTIIPSYVTLQKGITPEQLRIPIKQLIAANAPENIQENLEVEPVLLSSFYLNTNNALVKRMLYTLSFVGLFILLMAVVNFINIAISNSGKRMREIGIRKVLGGSKKELIGQFLIEAALFVFTALFFALVIYQFARPWFANLIGAEITALDAFPSYFTPILVLFGLILSLLVGIYPAFVLSSLATLTSLKGKIKAHTSGIIVRKLLVGFQFAIAFVLAVSAIIITKQTSYFFNQDLGYNKDAVITAAVPRDWSSNGVQKMETIRQQLLQLPAVEKVSLSYEIPNGNNGRQMPIYKLGDAPNKAKTMKILVTDDKFIDTYAIDLMAGSFFNSNLQDSTKVVINTTASHALGWQNPEEAVGKTIKIKDDPENSYTVTGVINDFHFGSKQELIAPQLYFNLGAIPTYRYLSFKLHPKTIGAGIAQIQDKWSSLLPQSPFEYTFMDETLATMYANELQLKKATYYSTGLALILVILGIFGLVSLSIHNRKKEIGIRKVLGASAQSISILLFKEFLITLGITIFIAAPLAFLLMRKWLQEYAYSIKIPMGIFVWVAVTILLITFLLVSFQTLHASRKNPVTSLRTE